MSSPGGIGLAVLVGTGLSSQQLMEKGRKEMKAQDDSLIRAQRIVESTIEVGTLSNSCLSLMICATILLGAHPAILAVHSCICP